MVGLYCCIVNCTSKTHDRSVKRKNYGIRFFKFPTCKRREGEHVEDVTRRRRVAWIAAARRKDITYHNIPVSMRVCSLHFHSGQPAYEMFETHPDWAPSLLLGHSEVKTIDKDSFRRQLKRHERITTGEKVEDNIKYEADEMAQEHKVIYNEETEKVMQQEVKEEWAQQDIKEEEQEVMEEKRVPRDVKEEKRAPQESDIAQNPDNHSTQECDLCMCRQNEINRLLEENRQLKHKLDTFKMAEEFFKDDDDEKVKYYTGIPGFAIFQVLLSHVIQFLPGKDKRQLTCFQMLLLTFMRLRLDLPIQHIAHLFNVDRSTVSTAFKQTVSVLYSRLSPLVHWPDRESLQVSMPHQFVEIFGNHFAAIVDCFEVSIERPSYLQARAQTFLNHEHTLKYLICIIPQGVISFISKGFGGRTSDKQITENCGFLDKLLPGDIVLADKGFDIKESVGLMCAEVKISAFTKGQRQLEAKDVKDMTSIAHLRIHLERVIGVVRNKYKILSTTIPISMVLPCELENVTFLDKIVTVCCALVNMCPSVVQ
ncbi:uncharacterized protein [Paramisgurnus dabryanus]|uniref:uncharacterized protein n=1 Tax=Paramisgurnus dabryanus TaxID=90735 RepID=UPI0031F3431D